MQGDKNKGFERHGIHMLAAAAAAVAFVVVSFVPFIVSCGVLTLVNGAGQHTK